MAKSRLDDLLVGRGLAADRAEADRLLMSGRVFSRKGHRLTQAGRSVEATLEIEVRPAGGLRGSTKLEGPLEEWKIAVRGKVCADIGAAAGGFTMALLGAGARKVYAIDVGKSLLIQKLQKDPRVVMMDGTNARYLTELPEPVDLFTVDVSFISLAKIFPAVQTIVENQGQGAEVVALVKPQFEVGREVATKFKGVITDPSLQREAVDRVRQAAEGLGFEIRDELASPLKGPKGNQEWFLRLRI